GRNVVLGDPGGGKSTLARKTAYDVSTDATEVCAVFVTVRDYGAAKKDRQLSILEFVRESARTTYQLEEPPSRFFEYIASNGRAVFIFDGLDELLETSYRQEVTGDIESFCHLYPSARVLATARRVGYAEAPLDEALFSSYGLAEFSNEQVGDYVTKWFGSDESLTDAEREALAAAFLSESQAVSDLRSNPLMLALMCNIYKAERYIPRNRPEVYERCSLMMFEQWDRSRGIKVELPFQAHVLAAMQFLAHWIYSSESLQGGVARSQLISKATEYLYPRRFEDPLEAEAAAKVFIKFCTNRAWVFTDVGLTPEGEPLFAFTHRTFLEYFTARHIVRTTGSTEQLTDLLLPRVAAAEWEVVAQLAVQLRNNHQEGAGDEILHRFLDVAATADPGARQLVGFAARCLAFLVPTPELVRRIVANSIDEAVASAPGWHQALYCPPTDNDEDLSSMGEGLATFISSSEENATIVARALADETRRIWAMGGWHTHLAADLLLRAPRWGSRVFADLSLLTEEFRDDLRAIALREWWLSAAALRRGLVSLREVLDRHGLAPLLHIDFSISFFTGEPALASSLQRRDPSRLWPGADVGAADGLAVVGRWLLSLGEPPSPAPYCRVNSAYGGEMANSAAFDEMSREEKVAIVMFAMVSSEKRSMLDNTDRNLPLRLRDTAESGGARVDLMDELGEWGAVVERWLRREVSFVSGTA
ncbi:MAG TPA: NACHT domain-containing protein, partial [Terriglobales bacterium]|nr:NACHT domain-containing protein [Terriglobales bacterium]